MAGLLDALTLARYNLKISCGLNTAAALLTVLVAPVIFSLEHNSPAEIAQVGELYIATIGILLLTPLSQMEERDHVQELVYARPLRHWRIFLLRLILIEAQLFAAIGGVIAFAYFRDGAFDFWRTTAGVLITAIFLGVLGLTAANGTKDLKSGYLIAFGYYLFEFFTRGKYTSDFFLFSLINNDFEPKLRLLAVILFILGGHMLWISRKA